MKGNNMKYKRLITLITLILTSTVNAGVLELQNNSIKISQVSHFAAMGKEYATLNKQEEDTNLSTNSTKLNILSAGFELVGQLTDELNLAENDANAALVGKITDPPLMYPNPFRFEDNPVLGFGLNKPMTVRIVMYDMLANKILDTTHAGINGYNRIEFTRALFGGHDLSAGIYFYLILNEEDEVLGKGKAAVIP